MTASKISELVRLRFGETVEVSHLDAKPWLMEEKTKKPWRDYLLSGIQQRLDGAAQRGVAVSVIEETESFRRHLERFTPEQSLYSFSASSAATAYAGWVIDDNLVFCIPSKKEPNQSSEPTTTSVTICAEPQIAPAAVVAHL